MADSIPFPIDLSQLKPLSLHPSRPKLEAAELAALSDNIRLTRDAIVFFTALADAKGLSGHTGGAFDIMPEVLILRAFVHGKADLYPTFFEEAGHRVAAMYLLSVIDGHMPAEKLLHYREFNQQLPGHPERFLTPGIEFSSGRLGHIWAYANGVAMANPGKAVAVLGSDGAQMEGDDAEAARLAVAQGLNVKVIVDDNNVTISGHPKEYMKGYDIARTLQGHGLEVMTVDGEDWSALYATLARAMNHPGPVGVIVRRSMAPGIEGLEGHTHAHEAIKLDKAVAYLERAGHGRAIDVLKSAQAQKNPHKFRGSSGSGRNRDDFGKIINEILEQMPPGQRRDSVRVFDNDLEGSCGLHHIRKKFPEVFVSAGIMERGNFSAAAGFGHQRGRQGIYATFSAFLEMCISEITMARLNHANVLAHFSHSGVDDMADNTCHFGINSMFADGGLTPAHGPDTTRLYFPADQHQFAACVRRIFSDPGLRFVFSTRAPVPDILDDAGQPMFAGKAFEPGRDDLVRPAERGGYVVSFGEALYRSLDAVLTLRDTGLDVGLVNKPTLNLYDEAMMKRLAAAPFVLVVEGFNARTGLGSRFGTELLKRGFKGRYNHIGTHREGPGGLWQQMGFQGLDPTGIATAIKALAG
jgi:transketolase